MDAFFASVEVRDDPSLRGKPVLVGGTGKRGVVAAASYEARRFGCRSAMPMAVALRRCPQALVLPPRFEAYSEASRRVFEVFERFSPVVEGLSIDEAFIDLAGTERLHGPARQAGETLRAAVFECTRLTCSVGISAVKFIAKIASAMNKPDGLTEVAPGRELDFLHPLPVAKLWGVGPKTEQRLREHGIRTIGDVARLGEATLESWFGEAGRQLHRLSHAIDPRAVEPGRGRKSISHEDTFGTDVVTAAQIRERLLDQATRVADRLVSKGLAGRKVAIKIRDVDFKTESRQCTLDPPTQQAKVIHAAACRLLEELDVRGRRFRLTGVGVGELVPASQPRQLELLSEAPEPTTPLKREQGQELQGVLSAVRQRFGDKALFPADAGQAEGRSGTGAYSKTLLSDDEPA